MKKLNIITLLCGLIIFITSCGGSNNKTEDSSTNAPSDDKGEVAIGNQVWTSKNLNESTYRNGDTIPQVQDTTAWVKLKTGAWCYYENKTSNGTKYGKLYNWYAVNDPRGLAPIGYHIPTLAELTILSQNLGDEAGTKMKSNIGWDGTNTSGFDGLPGGFRGGNGGFKYIGSFGGWWSSKKDVNSAWIRYMFGSKSDVCSMLYSLQNGFSVRCIKN